MKNGYLFNQIAYYYNILETRGWSSKCRWELGVSNRGMSVIDLDMFTQKIGVWEKVKNSWACAVVMWRLVAKYFMPGNLCSWWQNKKVNIYNTH